MNILIVIVGIIFPPIVEYEWTSNIIPTGIVFGNREY